MSAEVERVFSAAKSLITRDRDRLTAKEIEVLVLLKYWLDHNLMSAIGIPAEEEEE